MSSFSPRGVTLVLVESLEGGHALVESVEEILHHLV